MRLFRGVEVNRIYKRSKVDSSDNTIKPRKFSTGGRVKFSTAGLAIGNKLPSAENLAIVSNTKTTNNDKYIIGDNLNYKNNFKEEKYIKSNETKKWINKKDMNKKDLAAAVVAATIATTGVNADMDKAVANDILPAKKPVVVIEKTYKDISKLEKPKKEFLIDNAKKIYTINESQGSPGKEVIPSSILIAMAAHETGWGKSRFFNKGNNLFNLEAQGDENFLKALEGKRKVSAHNTTEENISKMLNWINTKPHYKIVRDTIELYQEGKANKDDIIDAIAKTGFAEDKKWASKVKWTHKNKSGLLKLNGLTIIE